MEIINLIKHPFSNDRSELRKEIINIFLFEKPGTGREELTSRYKYITKIIGAHDIYLSRPAQFNNGFDFISN